MNATAWLIEVGSEPLKYWNGHGVDRLSFNRDITTAIRFSRREDAEAVRCWLLENVSDFTRTVEHLWMSAAPLPTGTETR